MVPLPPLNPSGLSERPGTFRGIGRAYDLRSQMAEIRNETLHANEETRWVHPGVGPHRPVTNDRDRRRSPRLFFLPFCYLFLIGKAAYFRIFSHFDAALPGLEPPMFYLRKKNTKFDAKSDDRCSVSKGKWQKEAVLWAACTSRGGQYD